MKNKITYFDPDTSFFELKIVRLTALKFMLIFLLVCGIIIHYSNLWGKWDFTHTGFNNLLDYFKVPLGFLALMIPVGAVFAANHRSEQTKKQITLTHNQNLFINYYKHLEEFEKHSQHQLTKVFLEDSLLCKDEISIRDSIDIRKLHKIMYTDLLESGNIKANTELLHRIEKACDTMLGDLTELQPLSLSDIKMRVNSGLTEILELIEVESLDFGGLFLDDLDKKQTDLAHFVKVYCTYSQQHPNSQVSDEYIYSVSSCYFIIDVLERITKLLKTIDACASFDTSFKHSEHLLALEHSQSASFLGESGERLQSPHLNLLVVRSVKDLPQLKYIDSGKYTKEALESYVLERFSMYRSRIADINNVKN